jgi:hypothetical protein
MALALTGFSAFGQQAAGTAAVGVQGNATANTQTGAATQADTNAAAAATPPAAAPNQPAQVGMALPNATAAEPPAGTSDHDALVGHLAVGYLGTAGVPYGLSTVTVLSSPVIGVRYWIDPTVGLDLGLGLWLGGTSRDNTVTPPGTTVSVSGPKSSVFILHAGIPLALASSKHFTFEVIPEANFGYGQQTQDAVANPLGVTKQTGVHLDMGARAGAEIHFGFIGVPQLSLVGSVGLRFDYDKLGSDATPVAPGSPTTHVSTSVWGLQTAVNSSPWAIFTNNISAFYYF